jgi:glutamate dehydrogenase
VPEIVLLAEAQTAPAHTAAQIYFAVGAAVGLDRLRALASRIVAAEHWDRLALRRIVDDLFSAQRLLACDALSRGKDRPEQSVEAWTKLRAAELERTASFLSELERGGEASIAKLALANSQIQKLAAAPA